MMILSRVGRLYRCTLDGFRVLRPLRARIMGEKTLLDVWNQLCSVSLRAM